VELWKGEESSGVEGRAIMYRDFTTDYLGVRVYEDYCIVIEKEPDVSVWQEHGQGFPLPLQRFDSLAAIPASRLALAVSAYEMNNPGNTLIEVLTRKLPSKRE
jgi:hypothetical protein